MQTTGKYQDWIRRGTQRRTHGNEAELLTEILTADETQMGLLASLARAKQCQTLFRCAAIDQYLKLMLERARGHLELRELRAVNEFLLSLAHFETEANEDVRFAAAQWYVQMETDHPIVKRSKRLETLEEKWRQVLRKDPSPRIRWLASLGE